MGGEPSKLLGEICRSMCEIKQPENPSTNPSTNPQTNPSTNPQTNPSTNPPALLTNDSSEPTRGYLGAEGVSGAVQGAFQTSNG